MLKSLKIVICSLKKDALRNIIMFIFVALAACLMNISLSQFMHREYLNNFVKDYGLYENYMYTAPPAKKAYGDWNGRYSVWKSEEQLLDEMKENGIIENWYTTFSRNIPLTDKQDSTGDYNDRVDILYYPREFVTDLKYPVSRGIWFDKYEFYDSRIPVVIGSELARRYNVGETFSLFNYDEDFVVIGILERNAMVLDSGMGGNGANINGLFENGNAIMITVSDNPDSNSLRGAVIKVKPENQVAVFNAIGNISYTFTFQDISDRAYNENRLASEIQTIVFILMMIVCVAGVSSGNLMSTISQKKRYAIYFFCGMNWSIGVLISLAESLIKLVAPTVIGYVAFYRWCVSRDFYTLRVTETNLFVTVAFLIGIFLLTSFTPLLDIKRSSPVRIISEI